MNEQIIDIVTDKGIPFRVVYGHKTYKLNEVPGNPVVAFYDRRYDLTKHGQLVATYNVETMLERDGGYGLNLYGGEPDWSIDATAMTLVKQWLVHCVLAK